MSEAVTSPPGESTSSTTARTLSSLRACSSSQRKSSTIDSPTCPDEIAEEVRWHKRFSRGKRCMSEAGREAALYGNYDTDASKRTPLEERGGCTSSPQESGKDPKTPSKERSEGRW